MSKQIGLELKPTPVWMKAKSRAGVFGLTLLVFSFARAFVQADSTNAVESASGPLLSTEAPAQTNRTALISSVYDTDGLRMNFRGASLSLVLDYLSEAAGFVINKQEDVRGNIEIWSKQPVTRDEAVELLGSALKKAGYAMIRNGRILNIMGQGTVKTADTEIVVSNDPAAVQKSDEVQTQIIPIRYATATQLLPNLEPLLPTSATLTVNESANTLILVASKTDIKRVLKIVNALDNSLASTAAIKVLLLHYANAKETAAIITQLYSQSSNAQTAQVGNFPNFGGGLPGGFGGFPPGLAQNAATSSSSGRGSTAGRVNVVADDRANALIVSAAPDLLGAIQEMVDKLDQPVDDLTELRVFHLVNAEASELAGQLATLFPDDTSSNTSQAGNMPFFFPPGGGPSANSSTAGTSSERMKKLGRVLAVPDPRTSSLIVTAGKSLMPQIAQMIARLDADEGKREIVGYFELQHADPQDVSQNLQDLFNRSLRINNNNQTTLLGPNHPLTQRQTQNQQGSTSSSSTMSGGMGGLQSGTGSRSGF